LDTLRENVTFQHKQLSLKARKTKTQAAGKGPTAANRGAVPLFEVVSAILEIDWGSNCL